MKYLNHLLGLCILLLCFACTSNGDSLLEDSANEDDIYQDSSLKIESRLIADYAIPDSDVLLLQKLGFAGSTLRVFNNKEVGSGYEYISYLLEGDIEIKADDLSFYLPEKGEIDLTAQYRTSIIADPNTYTVIYDSPFSVSRTSSSITELPDQDISDAIDLAIENYNNLNLGIRFVRESIPTSFSGRRGPRLISARNAYVNENADIAIRHRNSGGAGGSAGFPKRTFLSRPPRFVNNPHKEVLIDVATIPFGQDVLEHVITHEIAHCIGFRHTDFFNRNLSCRTGGNEGQAGVGAIHIPGTPAMVGIDRNSIMTACFDGGETGEFTNFDIIALRFLW